MRETVVRRLIKASPRGVYRAITRALPRWLPPEGTSSHLYEFEPRLGGRLRMSITPLRRPQDHRVFTLVFSKLKADALVVLKGAFEEKDPALAPAMTLTFRLMKAGAGTDVAVRHSNIPRNISLKDNRRGSALSLAHLARFVEKGRSPSKGSPKRRLKKRP